MKRMMCIGAALLASGAAVAEPTRLGVTIQKDTPYITAHYGVFSATATSDVAGAEYLFALEAMSPVRRTVTTGTWGGAIANFELGALDVSGGEYRLRVSVRDPASPGVVLSRTLPFTVMSEHDADLLKVENEATVVQRYQHAQDVMREAIAEMKQRIALEQDITDLCDAFSSSEAVIATLINPEGAEAPEGGPAYVSGAAQDQAGAIGIEGVGVCSQLEDVTGIAFTVDFPRHEDLSWVHPPLTIRYTD